MPRKKLNRPTIIHVPEAHPSLNTWTRKHHRQWAADKKRWMEMVMWCCKGKDQIKGEVTIEILYIFPTKHRHDIDNYAPKFILDGIVKAGIIEDDCYDIVKNISISMQHEKGKSESVIIISPYGTPCKNLH